ncbi:SH3 domain-containing protein [Allorhizobium sp. BGMRC 0089]|uniref:SH3 domain-containing protein n=1 Tax=Allorhizobium sonneratiae TaxID=2934936 RepID=UPI0020343F12|nr:SH3 domain-containing protein [Allorhizobium sonneratiae]MCM2290781.1 SH3 domain-containing protein [Allorhizobium sonneratiae]
MHRYERMLFLALALSLPATLGFAQNPGAQQQPLIKEVDGYPDVIGTPPPDGGNLPPGKVPDPYLWHVHGLGPDTTLPLLSGAGPRFQIIGTLEDGMPLESVGNCLENQGGYWCQIMTAETPARSGWVDGRYLMKQGGNPPGTVGGIPMNIIIDPLNNHGGHHSHGRPGQGYGAYPGQDESQ